MTAKLTPNELYVCMDLIHIGCYRPEESGGDEPYLINYFFKIDGSNTKVEYGPVTDIVNGLPVVTTRLHVKSKPSVYMSRGGHKNLGYKNDDEAKHGWMKSIPYDVGRCWIRPFKRISLPPTCDKLYQIPGMPAFGVVGLISILNEQDGVPDHAVDNGKHAGAEQLRAILKKVAESISFPLEGTPDFSASASSYERQMADAIEDGIIGSMKVPELIGSWANPDDPINVVIKTWVFDELHGDKKLVWKGFKEELVQKDPVYYFGDAKPARYWMDGWIAARSDPTAFLGMGVAKPDGDPP